MDHLDNYCERVAPGLWSEPVNAVTNVAFLVAGGVLLWWLSRLHTRVPASVRLLPVTTVVVGVCSFAFHTFATGFTALLDTLSIVTFILIAAVVTVHLVWDVPWRRAWLAAPGYLVFTAGFTTAFAILGGERAALGGYLSALVGLVGFAVAIRLRAPTQSRRVSTLLLWAAMLFALSLTLRTLDGPLCEQLPTGTHFLWHCLNAVVLFLVSVSAIRCWQVRSR